LSEAKLIIVGSKVVRVSKRLAEKHYENLKDKPFFDELIGYIMGECTRQTEWLLLFKGRGRDK
jgi:nucleoside-diphosphate kinase